MPADKRVMASLKETAENVDIVGSWECPVCGMTGGSRKEWWSSPHRQAHKKLIEQTDNNQPDNG